MKDFKFLENKTAATTKEKHLTGRPKKLPFLSKINMKKQATQRLKASVSLLSAIAVFVTPFAQASAVQNSYTDVLNMNSNNIINVTDPSGAQDAATKKYVDDEVTGAIEGLSWKAPVDDVDGATGGLGSYGTCDATKEGWASYNQGDEIVYVCSKEEQPPGAACATATVDDADGNSYNTIELGTQCWMAENLNVGTRIDGSQNMTDNSVTEKYCYDDLESNCVAYGGLYQWAEAMDYQTAEGSQGICPVGWHLPTDEEWKTLEKQLGMSQVDADATGWRGTDEGAQLKDGGSSGFNALLAGYRYADGSFYSLGSNTHLWSGSESGGYAWRRYLYSGHSTVSRDTDGKSYGFSVRCLQDEIAPTYLYQWVGIGSVASLPDLDGEVTGDMTSNIVADNVIDSDNIINDTIVDADVNASAAIAGSKIAPDFGAQNVSTTGNLTINTDDLFVDSSTGNVGIGTTVPTGILHVQSEQTTSTVQSYTTAGTDTFLVPDGVTEITVKTWGAGGAGGAGGTSGAGGDGGGGGFATAVISVTPGETLDIHVGGGGGAAAHNGGNSGQGGGGGGRSEVSRSSTSLVVAAGGGGGGGGDNSTATAGGAGGAGGGATGESGGTSSSAGGGGGGTQSAGGSGGTGGVNSGSDGASLSGGAGADGRDVEGVDGSAVNGGVTSGGDGGTDDVVAGYGGGGGGGSGYFGGGGGSSSLTSDAGGGGGGGGANYVSGTSTQSLQGSGPSVANSGDSHYVSGHGNGSSGAATSSDSTAGQGGLVVIVVTGEPIPVLMADAANNRLGVGTATPTGTLDVEGDKFFLPSPTTAPADGDFADSQWTLWLDEVSDEFELKAKDSLGNIISQTIGSGSGLWTDLTGGRIHFGTAGTEQVGVGTDNPVVALDVAGTIKIANGGETCDSTIEGSVRYNSTTYLPEFCDGSDWRSFVGSSSSSPPTVPGGSGYFVLTSGSWNGDLVTAAGLGFGDGMDAANELCYQDLTANDWQGKTDAVNAGYLVRESVKAFLCTEVHGCNDPYPNSRYYYAAAGDTGAGGGFFDADGSNRGPGDNIAWSSLNRFNANVQYWSNRHSDATSLWNSTVYNTGYDCSNYTSSSSATASYGVLTYTNYARWNYSTTSACDDARHLVCLVQPTVGSDTTPPEWITRASTGIHAVLPGTSLNQTLETVDLEGTVTYSKVSGDAWINVSSGGILSGTAPGTPGTASVTVRADDGNGNTADRTFTFDITDQIGYFVLTGATYNGNLGGLSGADSECLTDLTNGDWKGKATANANGWLTSDRVKAFLCDSASCQGTTADTSYRYAISGDNISGGGGFKTDTSGFGPGDTTAWSHSSRFGGTYNYFTGRRGGTDSSWDDTLETTTSDLCSDWTSSATFNDAWIGTSSNSGINRWSNLSDNICDNQAYRLICMVEPTVSTDTTAPTWVTPTGTIASLATSGTLGTTVVATDDGGIVSYSKVSGDAWISVSSGGILSGTAPGTAGTASVTVRASDPSGNNTDRTFNVVISDTFEGLWTQTGNDIYYDTGKAAVGITSPTAQLHVKGSLSVALTGTVDVTAATDAVTGTGTAFTTELSPGDAIKIGSEVFTVSAITDDTNLTLDSTHTAGATGATAYTDDSLLAVENGDGASVLKVAKTGDVFLHGPAVAPADGDLADSQWTLWLDEVNDEFELKARDSGGNLISTTVGSGGGGDFANAGEAGTADRTLGNTDNYSLGFLTNNVNRLQILNDGKVGIGTATPTELLDVTGSASDGLGTKVQVTDADGNPELKFNDGTETSAIYHDATSNELRLWNGNDRLIVKDNGDIQFDGGTFKYDAATDTTFISNLQTGMMSFEEDAGVVGWTDLPVSSQATAGTVESYTAQLDGNAMITVSAEADGSGGIQNEGVLLRAPATAVPDTNIANSQWTLWLDEVNDEFELKARDSNGDLISQTVGVASIGGDFAFVRTATATNASSGNQTIIGVTDTTIARTITLSTADMADGKIIIVKDESGSANGTNSITIDTEGAETIDGVNSISITASYGVLRLYSNGSNWFSF